MKYKSDFRYEIVHCHVGSLEMRKLMLGHVLIVHCHVGSLEI